MINQALIAAFTGNIISFVIGTGLSWSAPILPKLNDTNVENIPFGRQITSEESSWIGSLISLGCTFGPFIFGFLPDRIGRKYTIILTAIPFVVSSLILAFAEEVALYYVARILCGLAGGAVFAYVPVYVGEIAEDATRGALSSTMNINLTFGNLFSYIVGAYAPMRVFNLILAIIPACFMVLFFLVAPESPYYLVSKGDLDAADKSLRKLRGSKDISKELEYIKERIEESQKGTFMDLFRSKGHIRALSISLALVSFQQLSGINVVMFYSTNIFSASGSDIPPEVQSIIIGSVLFGTSFITPMFVDRFGRKILLYISAAGMVISETLLGLYFYLKDGGDDVESISWLPVVSLIVYIITYNCGFGPLPLIVMGELFTSNVKSVASSLTSITCNLISFIVTRFFQSIVDGIGIGPSFWLFAGFSVVAFFFNLFVVIETKEKSFQEIQKHLEK